MPDPIDVSVLVVNWNAGDLLRRCIESIPAALGSLSGEVIVVDNASTDDSLAQLPTGDWLHVVRRTDNIGFAAGTNQAARLATGRQLLLLNPDTECRPGAVQCLSGFLDAHPELAAVGPRLLHSDGSAQRSCWRGFPGIRIAWVDALFLWKLPGLPIVRRSEVTPIVSRDAIEVDHLLGACILIARRAWEVVGPLDEGYFLFLEETDWCRRARRAGYRIGHLPAAEVVHHGEHSVYQVPMASVQHYYRSFVRFVRQDQPGTARLVALKTAIALGAVIRLVLWTWRLRDTRRDLARGMLRGYGRVLLDLPSL